MQMKAASEQGAVFFALNVLSFFCDALRTAYVISNRGFYSLWPL